MTREPTRKVRRIRFTRREWLQLAQIGGLAGAVGGLTLLTRESTAEATVRGQCRICTMHCGVVATSRAGRLIRVEGDLDSQTAGFLCLHGHAIPEIVHSGERIRRPLKRVGAELREISWEQALAEIAERMLAIKAQHGARALGVQTGWPFVRSPIVWQLRRLTQAFGTPNLATTASLCEASGRMGRMLVCGSNLMPDLSRSRTVVLWGANPAHSSPPFAHVVGAARRRGRNLIVIDPVRSESADHAIHLKLRPGTDGALALALLDHVIRSTTYDAALVAEHTVGFERLAALAATWPLARAEAITGVPRESIARAAQLIAEEGPTSIWTGLGVEHHENGIQTVRAITALLGICGYLGVRGGMSLLHAAEDRRVGEPIPACPHNRTPEPLPPPVEDRPIGYEEYPIYDVFNRQAQGMLFDRAILEGRPYPLRGLVLWGVNPLVTHPDARRLGRAYDALDLLVTVDPFLTESGERSDYVLPATTFAEGPTVEGDQGEQVQHEALAPIQHGARPDWRIVFDLGRALGLAAYFPWPTLEEALSATSGRYMRDPAHELVAEPTERPARFPTVSGKLELFSAVLERFGLDPLPSWSPPSASPSADFPLRLVTGPRTRAYINSQFRSIDSVRSKEPEPLALVHPNVASALGLAEGERVRVASPRGHVEMTLAVRAVAPEDTVVLPSGWARANANELTDADARDPISGFPALRSGVCRLERAPGP